MLAIGRALIGEPRLLLLDEPSLGLSPILVGEVLGAFRDITHRGTAALLAEQNTAEALDTCDRAYVLRLGRVVAADTLRDAFLGGGLGCKAVAACGYCSRYPLTLCPLLRW